MEFCIISSNYLFIIHSVEMENAKSHFLKLMIPGLKFHTPASPDIFNSPLA